MDRNGGTHLPELARLAAAYLAEAELSKRTRAGYAYHIAGLIKAGVDTVEKFNRVACKRVLSELRATGVKAITCRHYLGAWKSLSRWLYDTGRMSLERRMELRELTVRAAPPPPIRWLTRGEYERLMIAARAANPVLALAISIAAHTGLRAGELRSLHFEDLVLRDRHPFVRVLRTHGRETKSRRERTPAIMKSFAEELLAAGFAERRGPIFPAGGGRKNARKSRSPYVGLRCLEDWMDRARKAAGLGDDVTFVTLRHTYASWLAQGGVSIEKIASWLGNDVQVAWRHYVSLAPGGDPEVEKMRKVGPDDRTPPAGAAGLPVKPLPPTPSRGTSSPAAERTPASGIDMRSFAARAADEIARQLGLPRKPMHEQTTKRIDFKASTPSGGTKTGS